MKPLKLIAIAITAAAVAGPAFASGDAAQLAAQKRAYERAFPQKALAGSTGPQGQLGPTTTPPAAINRNLGHPTDRVRR